MTVSTTVVATVSTTLPVTNRLVIVKGAVILDTLTVIVAKVRIFGHPNSRSMWDTKLS